MTSPSRLLGELADRASASRDALRAAGIETRVVSTRTPGVGGLRYDLELAVWRESGVDSFAWTAYRRAWFGRVRRVADVEGELLRVLDRYLEGDS